LNRGDKRISLIIESYLAPAEEARAEELKAALADLSIAVDRPSEPGVD
jgi:hypothetical protein